ncbi:MAG: YraN family protein [Christensenella sp.]
MIDKQMIGKVGENAVCRYILDKGMKLLARNYRAQKGEIDLIAQDKDTLVFIEVKTRSNANYGTAADAVGYKKQQMIIKTAQCFIAERSLYDSNVRFDVAEVALNKKQSSVHYIMDAFML